ncbi:hypothetical protein QJQ45_017072, partial [Haematococcus lacustris]
MSPMWSGNKTMSLTLSGNKTMSGTKSSNTTKPVVKSDAGRHLLATRALMQRTSRNFSAQVLPLPVNRSMPIKNLSMWNMTKPTNMTKPSSFEVVACLPACLVLTYSHGALLADKNSTMKGMSPMGSGNKTMSPNWSGDKTMSGNKTMSPNWSGDKTMSGNKTMSTTKPVVKSDAGRHLLLSLAMPKNGSMANMTKTGNMTMTGTGRNLLATNMTMMPKNGSMANMTKPGNMTRTGVYYRR